MKPQQTTQPLHSAQPPPQHRVALSSCSTSQLPRIRFPVWSIWLPGCVPFKAPVIRMNTSPRKKIPTQPLCSIAAPSLTTNLEQVRATPSTSTCQESAFVRARQHWARPSQVASDTHTSHCQDTAFVRAREHWSNVAVPQLSSGQHDQPPPLAPHSDQSSTSNLN